MNEVVMAETAIKQPIEGDWGPAPYVYTLVNCSLRCGKGSQVEYTSIRNIGYYIIGEDHTRDCWAIGVEDADNYKGQKLDPTRHKEKFDAWSITQSPERGFDPKSKSVKTNRGVAMKDGEPVPWTDPSSGEVHTMLYPVRLFKFDHDAEQWVDTGKRIF